MQLADVAQMVERSRSMEEVHLLFCFFFLFLIKFNIYGLVKSEKLTLISTQLYRPVRDHNKDDLCAILQATSCVYLIII